MIYDYLKNFTIGFESKLDVNSIVRIMDYNLNDKDTEKPIKNDF